MKVTLSKRQIEFIKKLFLYYIEDGKYLEEDYILMEEIEKQLDKGIPGHSGKGFKFPGDGR